MADRAITNWFPVSVNSAVFRECTIDAETTEGASSECLPHGDIDVVAGQFDKSSEINWSFGVQLVSMDEVYSCG